MLLHDPLSALNTLITYSVQIAAGYLVTWGLCRIIDSPRIRLRLWNCFLFFSVSEWIVACLPLRSAKPLSSVTPHLPTPSLTGVWAVEAAWAPHLNGLGAWVVWAYLTIFVVLVSQWCAKSLALGAFLSRGEAPGSELQLLFENVCRELGIARCNLILLSDLRSPAMACWWRPRVLLPRELLPQLDGPQLMDILRHELTHVRRRDYLWDRLAALGCRLVFFHPAAWLAHRRLRQERELACDLAVVQNRADGRLQYAECLAKLAHWWLLARRNSPGAIEFATSSSSLATRVRAVLREPSPYSALERALRDGAGVLLGAMAVFFLPGLGVNLYWSLPATATRVDKLWSRPHAATRKRSRVRRQTTAQKIVSAQVAVPYEEKEREPIDAPAGLFSHLSPLPVLANSTPSGRAPIQNAGRSSGEVNDRTASINSRRVWDEGPMPRPLATSPNWSNVTIDAIRAGVALGRGGNDDGDSDEQGNH